MIMCVLDKENIVLSAATLLCSMSHSTYKAPPPPKKKMLEQTLDSLARERERCGLKAFQELKGCLCLSVHCFCPQC